MKKKIIALMLTSLILVGCGKKEDPKKQETKTTEDKKTTETKKEEKQESTKFNTEKINTTNVNKNISLKNVDIIITTVSKNKFTFLDDTFLQTVKKSSKNDRELSKATLNNPIGNLTIYIKIKNKSNKIVNVPLNSIILQNNIKGLINSGENTFNDYPIKFFNLNPEEEKTFALNYFFSMEDIQNIKQLDLILSSVFQVEPKAKELEKIGNQKFNID